MKYLLLFFIFCYCANTTTAQIDYFPISHYKIKSFTINTLFPLSSSQIPNINRTSIMNLNNSMNVSAYNYDDLAIFCKLEVQMEKVSGFPIKFRLGEVNDVERLEGKPYSIFY